jgi:hypothetical protein
VAFDPNGRFDVIDAAAASVKDIAAEINGNRPDDRKRNAEKNLRPHLADAYRSGFRDALRLFGIYRNGTQVIGCLGHPIKEIIAKVANAGIPIDECSKDI